MALPNQRPERTSGATVQAAPTGIAIPEKIFPVSWDQSHRDSRALAWRLNGVGPFEAIVCITRGGLVPAAIVARELGIRIIETVSVISYAHTHKIRKLFRGCGAARSGAPLIRDRRILGACKGPGSAAHHFVVRCARETLPRLFFFDPYRRIAANRV
jgi:hypothetical protein